MTFSHWNRNWNWSLCRFFFQLNCWLWFYFKRFHSHLGCVHVGVVCVCVCVCVRAWVCHFLSERKHFDMAKIHFEQPKMRILRIFGLHLTWKIDEPFQKPFDCCTKVLWNAIHNLMNVRIRDGSSRNSSTAYGNVAIKFVLRLWFFVRFFIYGFS